MSKIEQFHVGQRYFLGEVWVDDRDVFSQTECYTTQAEAMDELSGLAGECETDINSSGKRMIEAFVVEYEVKALDDDGTIGHAETVGTGVTLPNKETSLAGDTSHATAAIYRRSGEWLERNVDPALSKERAQHFVAILNEPVLMVVGDRCWEVGEGYEEEQDEWAVDE